MMKSQPVTQVVACFTCHGISTKLAYPVPHPLLTASALWHCQLHCNSDQPGLTANLE